MFGVAGEGDFVFVASVRPSRRENRDRYGIRFSLHSSESKRGLDNLVAHYGEIGYGMVIMD